MGRIRVVTALAILVCATVAPSSAQTITLYDSQGPRASVRVGYGGHGLDWDASIDSPLFADLIRVRAAVGQGRWDSEFDSYADPTVTRIAASALMFIRQPYSAKPYFGVGLSRYIPHGSDLKPQVGTRLIGGVEVPGERWTVGVEVELDVPRDNAADRPFVNDDLFLAGRIGIAVRRSF